MAKLFNKALEKVKNLLRRLEKGTDGDETEAFPINQKWEERIKEWKDRFGDREPDSGELRQYFGNNESEVFEETRKFNNKYLATVLNCLDWGKEGANCG